jgi:hypothetical protein
MPAYEEFQEIAHCGGQVTFLVTLRAGRLTALALGTIDQFRLLGSASTPWPRMRFQLPIFASAELGKVSILLVQKVASQFFWGRTLDSAGAMSVPAVAATFGMAITQPSIH